MPNLPLLRELKTTLEGAAFLVSTAAPKEAHAHIVKALVLVSRLEEVEDNAPPPGEPPAASRRPPNTTSIDEVRLSESESEEVKKVRNRLRLWSGRPQQINTRILRAYLELERSGRNPITEALLRSALPSALSFDSNFAQMKIIAERNHGKVFEAQGGHVVIWSPVEPFVRQFEREVFAGNTQPSRNDA